MTDRYPFFNIYPAPQRRVLTRRPAPSNEKLVASLRDVPVGYHFDVPLEDFPAIPSVKGLANRISARAATMVGQFVTQGIESGVRVWRVT